MSEILEVVGLWIEQIVLFLGYPGIALVMLAENLFPPIPSELVMPFAGFLVARGEMNFVGIVVAGTIGSTVGAVALYYLGLWADEPVVRRFARRYGHLFQMTEQDLDRVLSVFDRYGEAVVFFGRLVPLVRSLLSIPAGMHRMPMGRFLLFTTLGSLLWNIILGYAGVLLGANWERILDFISQYQIVTLGLLGTAVLAFILVRFYRSRTRAALEPITGDRE